MAAVAHDHVGVVINELHVGLVELGRQVRLGHRQTHGVGDALTQRAGGDLHAGGLEGFGVAWGAAAPLAELLDVLKGHRVVAGEVQQRIEQHAAVTGGQHKAVAVEPLGVLGVVAKDLVPQRISHRGAPHRQAGVAGVALVDRVDRQEADAVDTERVDGGGGSDDHGVALGVGTKR